ncbi:uncharacterized protein LOC142234648 [Haematobia irritans]|uniref:uncharacterized protein LOC142234648 n=1 Tax=Haematobia irritans TaxID=7368 RepID=UPI003F4F6EB2
MEKFLKRSKDSCENDSDGESDCEILPSTSKLARKRNSSLWLYFRKSTDGKFAECKTCKKMYKTSGNTSNLLDHLKRAHPTYQENTDTANAIDVYFKKNEF